MARRAKEPCPLNGKNSGAFPGHDQCPGCGRMVYIRNDGTIRNHFKPVQMRRYDNYA